MARYRDFRGAAEADHPQFFSDGIASVGDGRGVSGRCVRRRRSPIRRFPARRGCGRRPAICSMRRRHGGGIVAAARRLGRFRVHDAAASQWPAPCTIRLTTAAALAGQARQPNGPRPTPFGQGMSDPPSPARIGPNCRPERQRIALQGDGRFSPTDGPQEVSVGRRSASTRRRWPRDDY